MIRRLIEALRGARPARDPFGNPVEETSTEPEVRGDVAGTDDGRKLHEPDLEPPEIGRG